MILQKFNLQDKIISIIPKHLQAHAVETFERYSINTVFRACHFLSQVMHESGDFKHKEENLNYSQKGLLLTFPKYFTIVELAERYKNNPQKIANRVYANRMGNGDEESGDGWRHRGLTYMMLTGKETQEKVMKDLGLTDPEQLKEDRNSMLASGWFWDTRKINLIADKGLTEDVIKEVTRKVNGGLIGLAERIEKLNMICDKLQFQA